MNGTEKIMKYITEKKAQSKKPVKKYKAEGLLRAFTQNDWYGWAGATELEIGGPFIYNDGNDNIVLVSGTGDNDGRAIIELDIGEEDVYSRLLDSEDDAIEIGESIALDLSNGKDALLIARKYGLTSAF